MGSDKKRKHPQDADPGPAGGGGAKKSPATANKRLKPVPSAAAPKPEPAKRSTLRASKDEETSFPRGGGSILTPLEFKQISNDAAKDVLFETENAKAKSAKKKPMREGSRGDKRAKKDESKKSEQKWIKAEGLSYKRLLPGTLVLGCISQINQTDLALALPNNLTGFVPLTSISESLNKKVEALVRDSDDEDEDGEEKIEAAKSESSEDDVDLTSMFQIRQYLRAYVVSSSEPANSKSSSGSKNIKKRIELSLDPAMANSGLTATELVVGCTIQASVTSVEDHGLVMNLGIGDDLKGFLSSKELGKGRSVTDAKEGQVMLCTIIGLSSNGKIVKLSGDLEQKPSKKGKYSGGKAAWWLGSAPTVNTFLPGTGVEVLVTDIAKGGKTVGIAGKVMGLVDATMDFFHASGWEGKNIESKFKVGEKIKARVIATYSEPHKLALSILPHILSFTQPIEKEPTTILPTATIINSAKVLNIEPKTGLFLDVGVPGIPGFVHISRVSSNRKIDVLSEDSGLYQTGSAHMARVIGYNSMDGLYLASMEQNILDQPFLRVEDIKVGEVVKGTIDRVLDSGRLIVSLAEGITGMVDELHLSDIKLKHPERKFRKGVEVKARVLLVDPPKRRVRLTLKKAIVNSDAPIISSYEDATSGTRSVGTLIKILPNGAIVRFFSDVCGFLPISEMSEAYIQDPREHFTVGQSVNVHVLSVDPANQKLRVSRKDPNLSGKAQKKALAKLSSSSVVSKTVVEKSADEMTDEPAGEGLSTGGFDWSASILDRRGPDTDSERDTSPEEERHKKKRKKAQIKEDLTGNLATREPQSVADFERLLLGDPNDSKMWIMYMSFQLQLNEVEKAREIAERAIKTIALREEKEKQNVWTAMLNMESTYGTDETLEEAFKRACQYNEAQSIHEKLASIYIQTGKTEKADDLFKVMIKKFSQDPRIWVNYADFLLSKQNREAARALLQRAMQALPQDQHKDLISKFAKLEFRSGDPERGRTLFENLLATFKKKSDLYNMFLDMEIKYGSEDDDGKEGVRALFKRALAEKTSTRQAKALFKKWLGFEKSKGDEKSVETVTRKAKEYVEAKKGE